MKDEIDEIEDVKETLKWQLDELKINFDEIKLYSNSNFYLFEMLEGEDVIELKKII